MAVRYCTLLLLATALPAQVALAELAGLARARAERARPAQEKALEPYWNDLRLDYRQSERYLDGQFPKIAALGDSVVPLLLEKLSPASGAEDLLHLAANCRRVLTLLDPGSFVDALAEYANGRNQTARDEAVRLLGHTNAPQATQVLVDLLDRTGGEERKLVLRSLTRQRATSAAPKIAPLLGSSDRGVREDVLNYLVAAKPGSVADTVLQALANEKENRLLPAYVEYCAAAVREHDLAARTLVGLIGDRLTWQDTKRLVQALATVAPRDHDPTTKKLHELLDSGDSSDLAVQAAVTLRALGDAKGVTKLKRALDSQLTKTAKKKDASLYEQRANLLYAIDEPTQASDDYEKVLEFTEGIAMTRRAYLGLIRCEFRRKRWTNATKHIKASGIMVGELEAVASDDSTLQEGLQNDKVRAFLVQLAKEQAPK
ncbi:MAG: hypothetical protein JNK49_08990 [Planctomycetes bacterium]|nr:hypothetical protein [Planctomycetota bacterium]